MQKEDTLSSKKEPSEESSQLKHSKSRLFFSRLKRKLLKHVWILRSVILASVVIALYVLLLITIRFVKRTEVGYYLSLTRDFVFAPEAKLTSLNGRTNILILGKGGEGHEAPELTDTIIFASVAKKDSSVSMISLPRDIWIPQLRTKLNSIYYWGNKRQVGGGIVLAKATVEEIIGEPVHYGLVLDFSGFKKIIDVVGGIDVEVERSFVDEKYPIPGLENDLCGGDPLFNCRYEMISFDKGQQHLDGETALKFVRSRNAEGDEGTDFARAARQQKVISAIKNKILSRQVLFSPSKLLEVKKAVEESVEGDIDPSAGAILARRLFSARNLVSSHILPEDLLEKPPYSPKYDNLYVFIPKGENWAGIHEWVKCVLENKSCSKSRLSI